MDQRDNIRRDRAHDGKPEHIDMTRPIPQIIPETGGADKVEVDYQGNVIGGATQVGRQKMDWNK